MGSLWNAKAVWSRHGESWSAAEDRQLLREVRRTRKLGWRRRWRAISKAMQRSVLAVQARHCSLTAGLRLARLYAAEKK